MSITAHPLRGPVDGPLQVAARGPLRAELTDTLGRVWSSTGSADDPLALLWSLETSAGGPLEESTIAPLRVRLEADGAAVDVERWFLAPDARTETPPDLAGTLFLPPGKGPFRAVVVLGGSAGGQVFSLQTAAALAGHGYAALALAYFGAAGVPAHLVGIPLEYFQRAFRWLLARDDVHPDGVRVIGRSRGGELALLLGATFPEVRAVVGYTPADVVYGGIRQGAMLDDSAWSHQGRPVPALAPKLSPERTRELLARPPFVLRPVFEEGSVEDVPGAVIPVERIRGPVLLVSGDDDQMWPATAMCRRVLERLRGRAAEHLRFADAGHFFRVPTVPTTRRDSPSFVMGGTPRGQAEANRAAWDAVLDLLRR